MKIRFFDEQRQKKNIRNELKRMPALPVNLALYRAGRKGFIDMRAAVSALMPVGAEIERAHISGETLPGLRPDAVEISGYSLILGKAAFSYEGVIFPGFSAPEIYSGITYGIPSDIYSFAAILFYFITGEAPENAFNRLKRRGPLFPAELYDAIKEAESVYVPDIKIEEDPFEPDIETEDTAPVFRNDMIDSNFAEILEKAAALESEERFQSMADFMSALAPYNTKASFIYPILTSADDDIYKNLIVEKSFSRKPKGRESVLRLITQRKPSKKVKAEGDNSAGGAADISEKGYAETAAADGPELLPVEQSARSAEITVKAVPEESGKKSAGPAKQRQREALQALLEEISAKKAGRKTPETDDGLDILPEPSGTGDSEEFEEQFVPLVVEDVSERADETGAVTAGGEENFAEETEPESPVLEPDGFEKYGQDDSYLEAVSAEALSEEGKGEFFAALERARDAADFVRDGEPDEETNESDVTAKENAGLISEEYEAEVPGSEEPGAAEDNKPEISEDEKPETAEDIDAGVPDESVFEVSESEETGKGGESVTPEEIPDGVPEKKTAAAKKPVNLVRIWEMLEKMRETDSQPKGE